MPSIRVRHSSYRSLNENPSPSPSPHPFASLLSPLSPTGTFPPPPRTRPSLPALRNREEYPNTTAHPRPRASSVTSRIQSHVLRNSVRNLRAPTLHGQHGGIIGTDSPQLPRFQESPTGVITPGQPGWFDNTIDAGHDQDWDEHHHDDIVEHLDAIDPQVGTVSMLTNAANSIVIPPTPFYSRRPVITLPPMRQRLAEAGSVLEDALDQHVDDLIRRPSKIHRTLLGIWAFLKTPMGIITGIYGFLVVFWGAAIVIFLARIINFHNANTQGFWVEVSSQVENGLFTVTGIGLIPSRVVDTYRVYKIWYYKRKTIRLRKKAGLPQLLDVDDLPDPAYDDNYVRVLTDEEQQDLHRQQLKFQYHQTWYRAHGNETHRAFPINTALLICFLNDGNSIFQILLCGTMWGLNRFQRPAWTTATLIPASFLCGIGAAVFIWRGGQKTKRVDEVREQLRAVLLQNVVSPPQDESRNPSMEQLIRSLGRRTEEEKPPVNNSSAEKLVASAGNGSMSTPMK